MLFLFNLSKALWRSAFSFNIIFYAMFPEALNLRKSRITFPFNNKTRASFWEECPWNLSKNLERTSFTPNSTANVTRGPQHIRNLPRHELWSLSDSPTETMTIVRLNYSAGRPPSPLNPFLDLTVNSKHDPKFYTRGQSIIDETFGSPRALSNKFDSIKKKVKKTKMLETSVYIVDRIQK